MKDPYIFELVGIDEKVSEKNLEKAMVEKIKNVLLELGKGFSFVGNQYKVSTENKDKLSVEWALKSANGPVGVASYEVKNYLPTEEEINSLL